MHYYPVYLDLKERPCVVVGGGTVAANKVRGLLDAEARVTVIAPRLSPELEQLARRGRVGHVARTYRPGDLAGAFLVIAATDNPDVNRQVWQEAIAQRVLVNVVDDPAHCTFIAPATVCRGDLVIAISTGGRAPALAVRLRQWLEKVIGDEYGRFLELAGELRRPLAEHYPDFEERRAVWYRLVDSDVFELLRCGDEAGARERIAQVVGAQDRGEALTGEGLESRDGRK